MSKESLVKKVAAILGGSQAEALKAVDAVAAALNDVVGAGATVRVAPLGLFKRAHKKARPGRNPRTGEQIDIPAKDVIVFKPSNS